MRTFFEPAQHEDAFVRLHSPSHTQDTRMDHRGPRRQVYQIDYRDHRKTSGGSQGRDYDRYYNDVTDYAEEDLDGFIPGADLALGRGAERILKEIRRALRQNQELNDAGIQISVEKGCVVLSGTAESRMEKRVACDVAESVPGVKMVQNRIRIRFNDFEIRMQQLYQSIREQQTRSGD